MIEVALPAGPLHVVCLAAHPDDIEIGCGGTLLTLSAEPDVMVDAYLLTGSADRVAECESAMADFTPGAKTQVRAAGLPDGRLPAHWAEAKDFLEGRAWSTHPDGHFCASAR